MDDRPCALLSLDFEDWNQLIARDLGLEDRAEERRAFERQMGVVLDLLDELGAKATFFVLGCTAERHPGLVQETAARGHEIGCHGHGHRRVFEQTQAAFRRDVERGIRVVEELAGVRPAGYRAPWFSVNRDTAWAHATLAELGFSYDSSYYDSPLVRHRLRSIPDEPSTVTEGDLLELPVSVYRTSRLSIPVGGGSYWRILPTPVLLRALRRAYAASSYLALYFHPHELDPNRLRVPLPPAPPTRLRALALYNRLYADVGRASLVTKIRLAGEAFRFVTYGEWRDRIVDGTTRPRAL